MRDLRWDNVRAVLILLVVFGHMLELCQGDLPKLVYQAIYIFHMPVFIFVTGYFAKFKPRAILILAASYVVFQTLYVLFDWGVLHGASGELSLQYLTPYWIMWYLLVTVFCYLLVPVFEKIEGLFAARTSSKSGLAGDGVVREERNGDAPSSSVAAHGRRLSKTWVRVAVIAVCLIVSLVGGYLPCGRWLSLGRFVAYLPCFAAGFFFRKWAAERKGSNSSDADRQRVGAHGDRPIEGEGYGPSSAVAGQAVSAGAQYADLLKRPIVVAVNLLLAFGGIVVLLQLGVSNEALYNASPYAVTSGGPVIRAVQLASSAGWAGLLLAFASSKKLPLVTRAGQCTMPIFLLHGFVVRGLGAWGVVPLFGVTGIIIALLLAVALTLALGQPALNSLVRFSLPKKQQK